VAFSLKRSATFRREAADRVSKAKDRGFSRVSPPCPAAGPQVAIVSDGGRREAPRVRRMVPAAARLDQGIAGGTIRAARRRPVALRETPSLPDLIQLEIEVNRPFRVLCPVDVTENAPFAIERALAFVGRHDAELILLRSDHGRSGRSARLAPDAAATGAANGTMPSRPEVRVRSVTSHGDPIDAIRSAAEALAVDLIVLGTGGGGALAPHRSSAFAARLAEGARRPTLVVPGPAGNRTRSSGTWPAHVLCAVSFSPASMHALSVASSLAEDEGSRVTALHVLEEFAPRPGGRFVEPVIVPEYRRLRRADAYRQLQRAVVAAARGAMAPRCRVTAGVPWRAIVRVADEVQADLIVMGIGDRGRLQRLIAGSNVARVVGHAAQPVLVVPPDAHVVRRTADDPGDRATAVA
jgi:nucleotide-binding universal stress UspA family protein